MHSVSGIVATRSRESNVINSHPHIGGNGGGHLLLLTITRAMPGKQHQQQQAPAQVPVTDDPAPELPQPVPALDVFYCEGMSIRLILGTFSRFTSDLVCTFPLEYCEFGSRFTKCKDWLKEERPDLFDHYYSEGEFTFRSSFNMLIYSQRHYRQRSEH